MWVILVLKNVTSVMFQKGFFFFFCYHGVTFFEHVPFYSSKGREILEPDKQGESPTLVQDVLPPSYPTSSSPKTPNTVSSSNSIPCESEDTVIELPTGLL